MPLPYTVWGLLVQKQVDGKKKGREREKERWGKIQWNGPICRNGLASYKNHIRTVHLPTRLNSTKLFAAILNASSLFYIHWHTWLYLELGRMMLPSLGVPLEVGGRPQGLLCRGNTRHQTLCTHRHMESLACFSELPIIILILEKKNWMLRTFPARHKDRISLRPMSWVFSC